MLPAGKTMAIAQWLLMLPAGKTKARVPVVINHAIDPRTPDYESRTTGGQMLQVRHIRGYVIMCFVFTS